MVEYITIGGLDELTTVSGTMYLEVEQDNVSKKIELSNLRTYWDYTQNSDPNTSVNPTRILCKWLNTSTGEEWLCIDNTSNVNVWRCLNPVPLTGATLNIDYSQNFPEAAETPIQFTGTNSTWWNSSNPSQITIPDYVYGINFGIGGHLDNTSDTVASFNNVWINGALQYYGVRSISSYTQMGLGGALNVSPGDLVVFKLGLWESDGSTKYQNGNLHINVADYKKVIS